jgi:outer membrane lipoprotein-sorting protein
MTRFLPLLLILLGLSACSSQPDPEQITKVQQNFDKIQSGMTKEQVRKLVGNPWRDIEYHINIGVPNDSNNICKPPCKVEMWLLMAGQDKDKWPHVVFDGKTGRVTRTFSEFPEEYFY